MLVVERGRVKLNERKVLDVCAHFVSGSDAVTRCDSGVRGVFVNSADAARCKDNVTGVIGRMFIVHADIGGETRSRLFQFAEKSILENVDIRRLFNSFLKL